MSDERPDASEEASPVFVAALADVMGNMAAIREAVLGHQAQLIKEGFTPDQAQTMAVELHNMLVRRM